MLKNEDFPTLGIPTMPHDTLTLGRPRIFFCTSSSPFLGGIYLFLRVNYLHFVFQTTRLLPAHAHTHAQPSARNLAAFEPASSHGVRLQPDAGAAYPRLHPAARTIIFTCRTEASAGEPVAGACAATASTRTSPRACDADLRGGATTGRLIPIFANEIGASSSLGSWRAQQVSVTALQ